MTALIKLITLSQLLLYSESVCKTLFVRLTQLISE